MKQPQSDIHDSIAAVWCEYIQGLEDALDQLEKDIKDASGMSQECTREWCTATEHTIDELAHSLFSIHEPKFASEKDTNKLKQLKRKVHDLYFQYKQTAGQ
jgi:DNA-directed RNA polymerase subunit N (RpoN/RPB10)